VSLGAEKSAGMRVLLRWGSAVLIALLSGGVPLPAGAAERAPVLTLASISHTLEGRHLIVSGWVENNGPAPVRGLVIDARGVAPTGETTAFGSDGIPWPIAPGEAETFSLRLPVDGQLIRAYTVQVGFARAPIRPVASVRRDVELALYRPLLLSVVRPQADLTGGRLTVRADAQRLPVAQVTVEVRLLLTHLIRRGLEDRRIEVLLVDVPGDGATTFHLGLMHASVLSLRVTDVRLKVSW
jgi:hypothetical protein